VKNQGRWLQHFFDDVSNIYTSTKDNNLNFIIVDYDSNDIDVETALKRSPLPKYQIITKKGKFRKTAAIQSALDAIDDPNSIVLTLDLHLEIPVNFFQSIRKHCIKGRMAFAPLVLRLNCGASPDRPNGRFWEPEGFGLLGMYKSDFDRIGGMNTKDFGEGWGGEDTETLDRILQQQIEVERIRAPKFFHFYHSKKGLWNFDEISGKKKHVRVRIIKRIIVKRGNKIIRVVNMPS
ncbi:uncharacterized protein TRIADDRAFT_29737, partial [Trichoplax adhaerens]